MTKHVTPRTNPTMATLYLEMMEAAMALADGHRRLMEERLGFAGAGRLRLLSLLRDSGMDGRAPTELASRMQMPKGSLARILRGLETDGLIETGGYRGDGRCKSIWITDIGGLAIEEMILALDRDLRLLADIDGLRMLSDARSALERARKSQATCYAYRKRGVRRTAVFR